jgi:hypothetical protein
MLLPWHRFHKSFQLPTPIRTSINSYRIGHRVPTFIVQPFTSSLDLLRPFSTVFELYQPLVTFELCVISSISFFRPSLSFFGLLWLSISSDSIDFLSRLLRPCAHLSDFARACSNRFYIFQPFTTFEFARFGWSASFDGPVLHRVSWTIYGVPQDGVWWLRLGLKGGREGGIYGRSIGGWRKSENKQIKNIWII